MDELGVYIAITHTQLYPSDHHNKVPGDGNERSAAEY
jgi:hypothetical protein